MDLIIMYIYKHYLLCYYYFIVDVFTRLCLHMNIKYIFLSLCIYADNQSSV